MEAICFTDHVDHFENNNEMLYHNRFHVKFWLTLLNI